jgi:hypothetical protein
MNKVAQTQGGTTAESIGITLNGMRRLNEEYVMLRRDSKTPVCGLGLTDLGMAFYGVTSTGQSDIPFQITVGFVPNENEVQTSVPAGSYGSLSFHMNREGNVERANAAIPRPQPQTTLLRFTQERLGAFLARHSKHMADIGKPPEATRAVTNLLDAKGIQATIPTDRLPPAMK